MEVDKLNRRLGQLKRIHPLMAGVKICHNLIDALNRARDRHRHRMLLAMVAQIGLALKKDLARGGWILTLRRIQGKTRGYLCFQHLELGRQGCSRDGIAAVDAGAHQINARQCHQHAPGRKVTWMRGNQHAADVQLFGQGRRVHGAAPPKGNQHKVARVIAFLYRDELERFRHAGVGHADNAVGRGFDGGAQPGGNRC